MNIEFLSNRTGIPVGQLRDILDHKLVPERTWMVDEQFDRNPDDFDLISATIVVCAAHLLGTGYKREVVGELISTISRPKRSGRNPLNLPLIGDVLTNYGKGKVQFADGRYVRWITDDNVDEWLDGTCASPPATDLIFKVVVEINIGAIRDSILDGHP